MNLTNFIVEDLKQKIQKGDKISETLTLKKISSYYSVSLTPVRKAVDQLISDNYLIKQPNGRLLVNKDKEGLTNKKVIKSPITPKKWDQILMKEVVIASLKDEPIFLREESIASKYNTGRSIIRQVFSRLAGSGLIEHIPHRGWVVQPFKEEDMWAYLEIRELLELKALELAKYNLEPKILQELLSNNPPAEDNDPPRYDNFLHDYMVEKSNNRYIHTFFKMYAAQYYSMLFNYATPATAVIKVMADQHNEILTALLARSWKKAAKLLSEHIRAQAPTIKELLKTINEKNNP